MKTSTGCRFLMMLLSFSMTAHMVSANEFAKLKPSDGVTLDRFGWSVAIGGDTALVGAFEGDEGGISSGSAYLFDALSGSPLAKLTASDGAADDSFGFSVAIDGNRAIVGANLDDDNGISSGSAYLFDSVTGAQLAKLTPSDGAAGDEFGHTVGISGNTAIVGARQNDDNGDNSGSAYLFDAVTGAELAKLTANDGAASDQFGYAVAISGNTAIVGARWDDDSGSNSGSAYLFDVGSGSQLHKLTAADGAAGDWFGAAVAISGTTAIVGAPQKGLLSGAAYLFDVSTGSQLFKLTPNDGEASGDSASRSQSTATWPSSEPTSGSAARTSSMSPRAPNLPSSPPATGPGGTLSAFPSASTATRRSLAPPGMAITAAPAALTCSASSPSQARRCCSLSPSHL